MTRATGCCDGCKTRETNYLCGAPFIIRTNHAALQWLMSFREPEGQVARWLEELQDFNFTVAHRSCHAETDAITHHPFTVAGCRENETKVRREGEGATLAG